MAACSSRGWHTLTAYRCRLSLPPQAVLFYMIIFGGWAFFCTWLMRTRPKGDSLRGACASWQTTGVALLRPPHAGFHCCCSATVSRGRRPRSHAGDALRAGLAMGMLAGSMAGNMWCVKATAELISHAFSKNDFSDFGHWSAARNAAFCSAACCASAAHRSRSCCAFLLSAALTCRRFTWCIIVGAASFALTQVTILTRAMREFEALYIIAVYQAALILSASFSGAVILKEFDGIVFWRCDTAFALCVPTGFVAKTVPFFADF